MKTHDSALTAHFMQFLAKGEICLRGVLWDRFNPPDHSSNPRSRGMMGLRGIAVEQAVASRPSILLNTLRGKLPCWR